MLTRLGFNVGKNGPFYTTNIVSLNKFKTTILNFIIPKENSVFAIHDTNGIKLLTRLGLNFTTLNEHKFRHGFRDMIDPMCKCGREPETTLHYLLCCNIHSSHRAELLNDICAINSSISDFPENKLLNTLSYGSEDLNNDTNQKNLKSTRRYLVVSDRFNCPLF